MLRQFLSSSTVAYRSSHSLRLRAPRRAFHSPFAALTPRSTPSPLTADTNTSSSSSSNTSTVHYEKQHDGSSTEVHVSHSGTRSYVVSTPDPADSPYEVPAGAYPNASPYQHPPATSTSPPPSGDADVEGSSSSASPAHPATTHKVPRTRDNAGVDDSAAVRFRGAPGEMGTKGGSDSGMDVMDASAVEEPSETLADRNPPPLSKEAEEISKQGVKEAWKGRK